MALALTPSSSGSRVPASPLLQLGAMPPPALSLSSGPSARRPFLPAPPASRLRFLRHACAAACAPYALAPSGRAPHTTGQVSTGATPVLRAVPLRRPPPVRTVAIARNFYAYWASPRAIARTARGLDPPLEKTNEAAAAGEGELEGMPPEFYDEEWQARQRERTKEWHAYRQKEEAEEERITNEYREIGMRLKAYPQEEVRKARILVSSFIRAGEHVEEEIEKAAERGELTELVLMVIWNRLDVARRDDERDAIRSLDLLYRRVETEILKSEATPAMSLLNELLNLHDGGDNEKWLKKCRKRMLEVFPREDPFTVVFPAGFNMENREERIELPPQDDDLLLRVDFVREVDELLKEVQAEQDKNKQQIGFDPESVAYMLKQQEKMQTICQVESLLDLASSLKW